MSRTESTSAGSAAHPSRDSASLATAAVNLAADSQDSAGVAHPAADPGLSRQHSLVGRSSVSLLGSYQRLQGTYTTLSYIVIFFLMLQGLRTKQQFNRVVTVAILVSFPIALYGLVQHFGLDPLPWGGNVTDRVASNMGNAIFVAAFLIMVVPLTLSRLMENWKEAVGGIGPPGCGSRHSRLCPAGRRSGRRDALAPRLGGDLAAGGWRS